MSKTITLGKRVLRGDLWHDDRGEIPGSPADWDPPMTEDERNIAALSDTDNPPLTPDQLARFRRVPLAKFVRRKLGMTLEQFAEQFRIPAEIMRAWEAHVSKPDQAMQAYLQVIERDPDAVRRALAPRAA